MSSLEAQEEIPAPADARRTAGWDLKNAIGNYSVLISTQIASAFFSFASVWIITQYLGKDGYGTIVAVIAASTIVQMLLNWTCTPLARFGVEEFVETGTINKAFWGRSLILLPSMALLAASAQLWLPFVSGWLRLAPEVGALVVLHFVAIAWWLHIQHAVQGVKLPRLQGALLTAERILIFGGLLLFVYFDRLTVAAALWVYVLSALGISLIGLWKLRKFLSWKIETDFAWMKDFLKFSIPLLPWMLIGYFSSSYLDTIFILQYLSKAELGVYSVANQANGILLQFPTLANSLLLMLFVTLKSSDQEDKIKSFLQLILPFATYLSSILLVLAATVLSYLLPLVFGAEFVLAGDVFWILAVGISFSIPISLGFLSFSHTVSATYISTLMAVMASGSNLAFNFFLIPRYGLIGCAWSTLLSMLLTTLMVMLILKFKFSIANLWTWQAMLPAVAGLVCFTWTRSFLWSIMFGVCAAAVLFVIYRKYIFDGVQLLMSMKKFYVRS